MSDKAKKTKADESEIEKLTGRIAEFSAIANALAGLVAAQKGFDLYDDKKDKCEKTDSGNCDSASKDGTFTCSKGKCKCKCHVYMQVGGQWFRAYGLLDGAEYGSAPDTSGLFPMTCNCVK